MPAADRCPLRDGVSPSSGSTQRAIPDTIEGHQAAPSSTDEAAPSSTASKDRYSARLQGRLLLFSTGLRYCFAGRRLDESYEYRSHQRFRFPLSMTPPRVCEVDTSR